MGKRYLIDTNSVLDYMGNKLTDNARIILADIIDNEINLSVINKMELLGFKQVEQEIIAFVKSSVIYPLDDDVVERTIQIRRKNRIKLPDAIIAATAMQNDLILVTSSISDFKNIKDLEIFNPYEKS